MTFEELYKIEELAKEFVQTLDDSHKDEWWATEHKIGDEIMSEFVVWLGAKVGKGI